MITCTNRHNQLVKGRNHGLQMVTLHTMDHAERQAQSGSRGLPGEISLINSKTLDLAGDASRTRVARLGRDIQQFEATVFGGQFEAGAPS